MEDGGKCVQGKERNFDFECQKPLNLTEAKRFESVLKSEDGGVASSTPEKPSERLACKSKQDASELPERHRYIVDLFRQMSCSLRLLGLCKKSTTFHNVCPQVEILAKRKFSYKHLGQIKYILPEAVQIQKVIVHDAESQCMKPDLKISLVFDVVKDHRQKSDSVALYHLFFSRVLDFVCTHSEGCDIPVAMLPQPFSQDNESVSSEVVIQDTSVELNSCASGIEPVEQVSSIENAANQKLNSLATPLRITCSPVGSLPACDSPLMNHSSGASNLMVDTPTQLPPKRASIETEESLPAIPNKSLPLSEKPAKRSLDFTFETTNRYVLGNAVGKTEHFMTLLNDSPQAARSIENMTYRKMISNEEVDGCAFPDPDQNDEKAKMSCKMPSNLRGCIPIIHQIFRSVDYSPMTKQELVFKILISSLDIEERGVVEEHLEQLEFYLPNWISKHTSSSGDLMFSIKKLPAVSTLLVELQS